MKKSLALLMLALCAAFSLAAFADQPIYKWTDSAGTVHYSDKPPKEAPADLQTMDLPAFPAQDPDKLAATQAEQTANTTALLKEQQAEAALQQQQAALAQQQAELQAEDAAIDAGSDAEAAPAEPIFVNSPFVPKVYRRNLYVAHPHFAKHPSRQTRQVSKGQSVMRRLSSPVFRP